MPEINASDLEDQKLIEEAALKAGEIALKFFGKDPEIWYKGVTRSPVSEADLQIDEFLKATLLAARPDYGWLSEETEDNSERLTTEKVFVVDPIDGTRAFIAGTDEWCVSIGIVENGKPINGVLNAPVREKLYSASLGNGACINGNPVGNLFDEQIETPVSVIVPQEVRKFVSEDYIQSIKQVDGLRSLALRIAGLVDNYADGIFVRKNSCDWDMIAAHLIVSEAGFKLVDVNLEDVVYNNPETRHGLLIATRPSYIANMRDALEI